MNPIHVITDFSFNIVTLAAGTISKPPKPSPQKDKHIILIPGFLENWFVFYKLIKVLLQHNYAIHTNYGFNSFKSIEAISLNIESYVSQHGLKELIIIGHSKGGIVANYLLQNQTVTSRISKIVTVSTPHRDTFPFNIQFIRKIFGLQSNEKFFENVPSHPILNVYSQYDPIVLSKNSRIDKRTGVVNVELRLTGHTKVLKDEDFLKNLIEFIK